MPIAMGLWDIIVWTFWFMLLVAWISLLIACIGDIFRDHELSGGKKALWVILIVVLPLLGCPHLHARPRGRDEPPCRKGTPCQRGQLPGLRPRRRRHARARPRS